MTGKQCYFVCYNVLTAWRNFASARILASCLDPKAIMFMREWEIRNVFSNTTETLILPAGRSTIPCIRSLSWKCILQSEFWSSLYQYDTFAPNHKEKQPNRQAWVRMAKSSAILCGEVVLNPSFIKRREIVLAAGTCDEFNQSVTYANKRIEIRYVKGSGVKVAECIRPNFRDFY